MKRAAAWISNACAAIANALLDLALRLEGPRKEPKRIAIDEVLERAGLRQVKLEGKPDSIEAPVPALWRLPTAEEFERTRADVLWHDSPNVNHVFICRGPHKGCPRRCPCDDCFKVHCCDKRSGAEILEAVKRGDA